MSKVNFSPLAHKTYSCVGDDILPESDPIPKVLDTPVSKVASHKVSKAEADKLIQGIEERKRHAPHNTR